MWLPRLLRAEQRFVRGARKGLGAVARPARRATAAVVALRRQFSTSTHVLAPATRPELLFTGMPLVRPDAGAPDGEVRVETEATCGDTAYVIFDGHEVLLGAEGAPLWLSQSEVRTRTRPGRTLGVCDRA